jgi:hypothetical protein
MSKNNTLEHIIQREIKKDEQIRDLEKYVRKLWTRLNNATDLLNKLNWSGDFCDKCNKLETTCGLSWWDQDEKLLCRECSEDRKNMS